MNKSNPELRYAFFLLLRATPDWLRLTREHRHKVASRYLRPLSGEGFTLRMRFFDAEAFTTLCSDVLMLETNDVKEYYFFMEKLRDSPLLTTPYFEVIHIVPTLEEGFVAYEQALASD